MENLKRKLRKIKCVYPLKMTEAMEGNAIAFLPLIHYVLLDFSPEMGKIIIDNGFDIYAK